MIDISGYFFQQPIVKCLNYLLGVLLFWIGNVKCAIFMDIKFKMVCSEHVKQNLLESNYILFISLFLAIWISFSVIKCSSIMDTASLYFINTTADIQLY